MAFIEWNDSFLLGIKKFDDHHKHLVKLLNTIYDDYTTEAPSETLGAILDELVDYATYHFASEEFWMEEQNYFKADEHAEEHDLFSKRVLEMQHDFKEGRLNLSLEILEFLRNWLTDHILKTDVEYGHYMSAKGVTMTLL